MKRLNPLYLVLLSCTILFVSFYSLNEKKKEFIQESKNYDLISTKAKEYKNLKANWDNEKFVNKTLDNILKNRSFKNQKLLRVKTKKSIKIKLESKDQKVLNKFLNMILNKKLVIKKLDLNKNYISLEIGVK